MKRNKSEFQKWASYTRWSTYTHYFSIWKTVNDRVPPKYKLSMTNFQYESAVQNWLCQQAVIFPFQWIKFIYFSVSFHLFFYQNVPLSPFLHIKNLAPPRRILLWPNRQMYLNISFDWDMHLSQSDRPLISSCSNQIKLICESIRKC